jgi:hypothetical protein
MVMCRSILVLVDDEQTKEGKTGLRQVILIKRLLGQARRRIRSGHGAPISAFR